MHADAEVEEAVGEALLKRDGAVDGLAHRRVLGEKAVAGVLDDAASMPGNPGIDDLGAGRPPGGDHAVAVLLHQPGVAGDVGGEDGDQSVTEVPLVHGPVRCRGRLPVECSAIGNTAPREFIRSGNGGRRRGSRRRLVLQQRGVVPPSVFRSGGACAGMQGVVAAGGRPAG